LISFGRTKIFTDETVITDDNVVSVLTDAYMWHTKNSGEIETLYNYYKGNQPILYREKEIRPEICNKIVENRANEVISFKTGYLCGEPLQYISRGITDEVTNGIGKLNDMMLLCGKPARDKEIAEWMYIAGQAYRMTLPYKETILRDIIPRLLNRQVPFTEDESPFEVYTLDPRYTFVVYSSALGERPLMGVKYITRKDQRIIYSVYTEDRYYEIEADNIIKIEKNPVGRIPIIEYPLNTARLGAFEIVLPILDAINTVQSNRLDGIEQFIQSLIVLTNAEIEEEKAKLLREAGLITLKSFGENKPDIKIIAEQLDQQQTQTLVDYMYQTVLNIVGMPNRNGGSSTSDTGAATIVRDGWAAAEARAKDDETMFKEAERQFLKIVLSIMRDTVGTPLKLSDIDVKFTRRNYENIQTKAQVLDTMLKNPKIDPMLAFTHCGMFSDPQDAAKTSAEYYEKAKAEQVQIQPLAEPKKAVDAVD
jgi:SPP1 family phage portal protein